MVQTQQVQDGRVKIVNRRDVFDGFVSEFVGGSVGEGSFDAGSGQPGGETGRVVVASAGSRLEGRHSTELGTPHDEGVFEETSLFEIPKQSGCRLVEDRAVFRVLCCE